MIFIKTLAIVIGFSSALVNDIYTFLFLRDFRITKKERDVFDLLANVNLTCAFILAISFLFSFIYEIDFVKEDILIATAVILLIVLINELLFRRIVVPVLANFRLNSDYMDVEQVVVLRKVGLTLNGVSVISWIYLLLIFQFGLTNDFFVTGYILGDYMFISSVTILLMNFIYRTKKTGPNLNQENNAQQI